MNPLDLDVDVREPGRLPRVVRRVVDAGNCSGCGGCASIWPEIEMELDHAGYLRPTVTQTSVPDDRRNRLFRHTCPGVTVTSPPRLQARHWLFGAYLGVWEGHAKDDEIRYRGSSGGVLTALAAFVATKREGSVVGVGADSAQPNRSVPVTITTRDEALRASGSRYAPVGVASSKELASASAVVAKPCEVAFIRASGELNEPEERPILLSFFCAGTPSQHATTDLLARDGIAAEEVIALRYRGNGWPGEFVGTTSDGRESRASYDDSWGKYLGRTLQTRCKICVDGTGELADISVGDYWQAGPDGYPEFSDRPGSSVVIARTERGATLIEEAINSGIIDVSPVDLDSVARIQPLQRDRRRALVGRLAGRLLAFRPVPRYRGFGLLATTLRNPRVNARALIGMWTRSVGLRNSSRLRGLNLGALVARRKER